MYLSSPACGRGPHVASIHPSPLAGEGARRADEGFLRVIFLVIQRDPSPTIASQWFPLSRKGRGYSYPGFEPHFGPHHQSIQILPYCP